MRFQLDRDYRDSLKLEFCLRQKKNSSYSLRAFARDLDITYSRLHECMHFKKGISLKLAQKIAKSLQVSPLEKDIFIHQVESSHARSRILKENAHKRLEQLMSTKAVCIDYEEIISEWYHFAILELLEISDFVQSISSIALRLSIQESEVKPALIALKNVGLLIEENGQFRNTTTDTYTPTDVSNAAIKKFHNDILEKAQLALQRDSVDERDFSTLLLSIDSKDLPEVKKFVKKFRKDLNEKFGKSKKRDSVYALGVQFFRIDNNKGREV